MSASHRGIDADAAAGNSAYDAALDRLLERINYERADMPYGGRVLKLDRMWALAERLGNPQDGLRIVHVAGTKGKGSVATTVASILSAAGLKTGLFTSPHLARVEERIMIDGELRSPERFVELVDRVWEHVPALDELAGPKRAWLNGPTYFEVMTAMALVDFAEANVDAAVLEVGLGGRLDSTNICRPEVSTITSISFDHMKQLGNTLAAIAREKAGIIKPGVPLVSGVTSDEPREEIRRRAAELGCRLTELGLAYDFRYHAPRALDAAAAELVRPRIDFEYRVPGCEWSLAGLELNLLGRHQGANAAIALATIAELRRAGWSISDDAIRRGLAGTVLPARVEVVSRRPTFIVDSAHNVASVEALLTTLDESFAPGRRTLLFGTTKDKDARGMLAALLPAFDEIVLTRYLNNPRAVPPEELDAIAAELTSRPRTLFDDPQAALAYVRQRATPDELVCITGSFFLAAELREAVK